MKRIQLSHLARDDLDEIWLSIAPDNLDAADRFVDGLDELLRKLESRPAPRHDSHICSHIFGAGMRESTIREAKNALTRLIHSAEKGEAVRITRHGRPVAVLVSNREYQRLSAGAVRRDPWVFLERWRAQLPEGFEGLSDREVDDWRERSAGGGRISSWSA